MFIKETKQEVSSGTFTPFARLLAPTMRSPVPTTATSPASSLCRLGGSTVDPVRVSVRKARPLCVRPPGGNTQSIGNPTTTLLYELYVTCAMRSNVR